jgi:hypothetical protein
VTSIPKQLATFVAVLAVLFAGGAVAGQLIDADPHGGDADAHGSDAGHQGGSGGSAESAHGAEKGLHGAGAAQPVRGLAVAENGLRLVVDDPELARGRDERLRFRVVDERAATVRDFDVEHTKRMHLIVARRDLTGFQHLHPEKAKDGSWFVRLRLDEAGSYRLFADFTRDGEAITLASDLRVDGDADLAPLPAPQPTSVSDGGYDVRLDASSAGAGEESELRFTITRDGRPVDTEPYLGAGGHLVALREGDLAFLHVHPEDDGVRFAATFPTEGRYRLFLQFKHEGRVQTVAFTREVSR